MRNLRFKGHAIGGGGRWVYGDSLIQYGSGQAISNNVAKINEHTATPVVHVCLSTGLVDKNGKEVYENDILRFTSLSGFKHIYVVKRIEDTNLFVLHRKDFDEDINIVSSFPYDWYEQRRDRIEVIGNAYDNSESLEDEQRKK